MKLFIQLEAFRRVAIFALLLPISTVFIARTDGSTSTSRLLGQVRVSAVLGDEDASVMESYLRSSLSWQTHAQSLGEIKQHLKQLLKDFSQLGELRAKGTPRQQEAINRTDPPVQSMATDIAQLLLIAVAACLLCAAVNTSARRSASVSIPFAFSANHQLVPAGCYKVQLVSDRMLSLVDIQTGMQLSFQMVHPERGETIETRGRLVFRLDGGHHVLTEVRLAGSSKCNKLAVQPSLDHALAKQRSPEGSFTEIAMD